MESRTELRGFILLIVFLVCLSSPANSDTDPGDFAVMQILSKNLNAESSLGWTGSDPCKWTGIRCLDNRVTVIQLGKSNLKGTLPQDIKNLTNLVRLELQSNNLTGVLPSLKGMNSLQTVIVRNNDFTSIPSDFFSGLSSLHTITLDGNQFSAWEIPESLKDATSLASFSAIETNITGNLPDFFDSFPSLNTLLLSFNNLEGGLPTTLSQTQIQTLWINGQKGMTFTGSIDVLKNMTSLVQIWLNSNGLTGPIPDLSGLNSLEDLNFRDNALTGIVPPSLISLPVLKTIKLTNNKLQGPTPKFPDSVSVDMIPSTNSFCLTTPGQPCDPRVTTLLLFARSVNFPTFFADNWKGNDPCTGWPGIICDSKGNITIINLQKRGLSGVISPSFQYFKSLQRLFLSNNNLTGTIPPELTSLPALREIDLSNNSLSGKVPNFAPSVLVNTNGNQYISVSMPSPSPFVGVIPGPQSDAPKTSDAPNTDDQSQVNHESDKKSSTTSRVVGSIVCGIFLVLIVGLPSFCIYKKKQKSDARVQSPNTTTIHAQNSGSDQDAAKITVVGSSLTGGTMSETHSRTSSTMNNQVQVVEFGNIVISIQVLRDVTNNFCDNNVIGQGGFGTVYKGELHDGTQIAVKRMMLGVIGDKGLSEFKSEISVLSKVRHCNLVTFLGYCLDVNERFLVLEYMPQGTLSRHLFEWKKEGLKPLDWTRRLSIALDVARGVEYLHNLAHQSFIHRDLKPSNILLGDNMRAKVADFGLVRLAPEGKCSVETRLAGTFGYLAPEYAVTGRVTTKADVFSFGVILMELITGRKALDESQPEESMHLVTWFRRLHLNKGSFPKVIDPSIDLSDETTISSINTVAELAGHCCAREPYQRPVMGHAVNVLSSLVEMWKPSEPDLDDIFGIDLDMPLSQALKKWQASEDSSQFDSSFIASSDNTQTSIPTRPSGFADSFTSSDGR